MVYSKTFNLILKELERLNNTDVIVFERLFVDLLELQKETRLSIREMVQLAVRQYIDREKSNDNYVWVDGVKYPIPKRIP
jgi:hypothetical protein